MLLHTRISAPGAINDIKSWIPTLLLGASCPLGGYFLKPLGSPLLHLAGRIRRLSADACPYTVPAPPAIPPNHIAELPPPPSLEDQGTLQGKSASKFPEYAI